jgi:hypothetical protein
MANPFAFLWRRKQSTIQVPKSAEADINTMYPQGFFRVLNLAGRPAGIGFYCRRCHLHVPHSAPATIFHCGANDTIDPKSNLPSVKLNNPNLPPTIAGRTMIDPDASAWNGVVEYNGNGGHSKTDDPFVGGAGFSDPSSGGWR